VAADAYFPITSHASTGLEAATVAQIRARLVEGRLDLATAPMISAWGRTP
jgi:hypothetical protein